MRKKLLANVGVITIITSAILIPSQANALTIDNPSGEMDGTCTTFTLHYDTFNLDRDNTNNGKESYNVKVTDGTGIQLFSYANTYHLIDQIIPRTEHIPLVPRPVANPITLTITSLAGNGFDEEVALFLEGSCSDIPSPPSITAASFDTDIAVPITGDLSSHASEPNSFPLTYKVLTGPTSGTLTLNAAGTFTYTPEATAVYDFIVAVANGVAQSVELPVTITVTQADLPPVDPPVTETPAAKPEVPGNQLAATGTTSYAGLATVGLTAGVLGMYLLLKRRKA